MFFGPNAISSSTVSANSWYSGYCITSPARNRTSRIFFGCAQMSTPPIFTVPDVGFFSPLMSCIIVLLPLPVCPIRPVMQRSGNVREMLSSALIS